MAVIPPLSKSLEDGLHGIEPRFQDLGQDLQNLYAESEALTKEISAFAGTMSGGDTGGILLQIEKIVNKSLAGLSGCQEAINESLGSINSGTAHLAELCSICERMKKSSNFLNIIGLNISVEGSRTDEARNMFGGFGEEIKALARNIGDISSKIQKDSRQVQTDQLDVHREITQGLDFFNRISESTQDAVRHAEEKMESIGNLAAQTLDKAGGHSREISQIVGEIVMSIQFHDIARQQVEHIVSALDDIGSLMQEEEAAQDEDKLVCRGQIQSLLTLQAAQLKLVVDDARDVYEKMKDAFGRVSAMVDQLTQDIAGSDSEEAKTMDLGYEVKNFQTKLEKLQELLTKGDDLESKIGETMDRSATAVSVLSQYTDQVNNINIDLQYKAINAIIMTSKLGEKGATLGVLARGVRDLAAASNTQVGDVLNVIEAITKLSGGEGPAARGEAQESGQTEPEDMSLEHGVEQIAQSFEQYDQTFSNAGQRAGILLESIAKTVEDLEFMAQWSLKNEQAFQQIQDLLEELRPWEDLIKNLPQDKAEKIAQRYTMESERRIHEQMAGISSESGPDQNGGGSEDGDLDDNIELF